MYIIKLSSPLMNIEILPKGGEISRIYHRGNGIEYGWDANPDVWGSHGPLLFPVIGKLWEGQFRHQGKKYSHPKHGLIRDKDLFVKRQTKSEVWLKFESTIFTRKAYPFDFDFQVGYQLKENVLRQIFEVTNTGKTLMPFALGGHPGFAIPFLPNETIYDYYLEFETPETADLNLISPDGFFTGVKAPFLKEEQKILITRDLFIDDALVFHGLKSRSVTLKSKKNSHFVKLTFAGFPTLAIWSKPEANFVCLEPWFGFADSEGTPQEFSEKEGIIHLEPDKTFKAEFQMEFG